MNSLMRNFVVMLVTKKLKRLCLLGLIVLMTTGCGGSGSTLCTDENILSKLKKTDLLYEGTHIFNIAIGMADWRTVIEYSEA